MVAMTLLLRRCATLLAIGQASPVPSPADPPVFPPPRAPVVRGDLAALVGRCGFDGVVVLQEIGSGERLASDLATASVGRLPASTFKIANALIALDLGTVADATTVIPWDGVTREREETNRDLDLATAFRLSSVPHFVELAKRAGRARLQERLDAFDYGNRDLGGAGGSASAEGATFWLDGALRITPLEQLDFLARCRAGPCRSRAPRSRPSPR